MIPKKRISRPWGAHPLMVRIKPDLLAALDAFIAERAAAGERLSRPEALRALAWEALRQRRTDSARRPSAEGSPSERRSKPS